MAHKLRTHNKTLLKLALVAFSFGLLTAICLNIAHVLVDQNTEATAGEKSVAVGVAAALPVFVFLSIKSALTTGVGSWLGKGVTLAAVAMAVNAGYVSYSGMAELLESLPAFSGVNAKLVAAMPEGLQVIGLLMLVKYQQDKARMEAAWIEEDRVEAKRLEVEAKREQQKSEQQATRQAEQEAAATQQAEPVIQHGTEPVFAPLAGIPGCGDTAALESQASAMLAAGASGADVVRMLVDAGCDDRAWMSEVSGLKRNSVAHTVRAHTKSPAEGAA